VLRGGTVLRTTSNPQFLRERIWILEGGEEIRHDRLVLVNKWPEERIYHSVLGRKEKEGKSKDIKLAVRKRAKLAYIQERRKLLGRQRKSMTERITRKVRDLGNSRWRPAGRMRGKTYKAVLISDHRKKRMKVIGGPRNWVSSVKINKAVSSNGEGGGSCTPANSTRGGEDSSHKNKKPI